jgi:hypothetical protein
MNCHHASIGLVETSDAMLLLLSHVCWCLVLCCQWAVDTLLLVQQTGPVGLVPACNANQVTQRVWCMLSSACRLSSQSEKAV